MFNTCIFLLVMRCLTIITLAFGFVVFCLKVTTSPIQPSLIKACTFLYGRKYTSNSLEISLVYQWQILLVPYSFGHTGVTISVASKIIMLPNFQVLAGSTFACWPLPDWFTQTPPSASTSWRSYCRRRHAIFAWHLLIRGGFRPLLC